MIWDKTKNELTIEWVETKRDKNEFHQIKKKPLRLQLHPTTGEVIRAHIKGARPAWVVKFAEQHRIRTHEAKTSEGKGWWIANWANYSTDERPLLCPFIKGMIEEWFEKLPEACQKDKEDLLKHIEIVEVNLLYHYEEFSKYGLHFRPEEILLDGGALVLDKSLLPKEEEEGVFQLADWPDYQYVVQSLQEVREIPEGLEVKARIDEVEDEPFVLVLPTELEEPLDEEDILEEEELTTFDDESKVDLDFSEEEEFLLPSQNMDEVNPDFHEELGGVFIDEDSVITAELVEEELKLEEPLSEKELEHESHSEPELERMRESETPAPIEEPEPTKMVVATQRSKKESIVVGQTLLF